MPPDDVYTHTLALVEGIGKQIPRGYNKRWYSMCSPDNEKYTRPEAATAVE